MRKNLLIRTVALVSFCCCCCAHAQPVEDTNKMESLSQHEKPKVTWTLLGPVSFYRAGHDGSYSTAGMSLTPPTFFCAGNTRDSQTIHFYSSCYNNYNNPNSEIARLTGGNPSLGIEMAIDAGGHVDKFFVNRLRDNFGDMGTMAGATRQWELASLARWTINGGLTAGLWNRTIETDSKIHKPVYYHFSYAGITDYFGLSDAFTASVFERQTIPFVSPELSLTDKSGLGLNLSILPVDLKNQKTLAGLMLQLTYKLSL